MDTKVDGGSFGARKMTGGKERRGARRADLYHLMLRWQNLNRRRN